MFGPVARRGRRALGAATLLWLTSAALPPIQNPTIAEAEFERLRTTLGLSQMSVAVVEDGAAAWVRHFGTAARQAGPVRYPLGSLAQPFIAALVFRLIEQTRLSLDVPVTRPDGSPTSLGHLLSHTTSGAGARFVFSNALFNQIEEPIERAAGAELGQALTAAILRPAGLRHTEAAPMLSATSGLVSTAEDVARFVQALEGGQILSRAALREMFQTPSDAAGRPLPHAYGWFVQIVGGQEVHWDFGQYGETSSLVVSLPARRLSLVVLASGDRLCSPFWLEFGDVRWSPAAMTFFREWARLRVDLPEARAAMSGALIALATGDSDRAATLAMRAAALAPALVNTPDLALLAAFARSGHPELRAMGRAIGQRALDADPADPRGLVHLALLNLEDGRPAEARTLLRQVLDGKQATPEIEELARQLLKRPDAPVNRPPPERSKGSPRSAAALTPRRASSRASRARPTASRRPADRRRRCSRASRRRDRDRGPASRRSETA